MNFFSRFKKFFFVIIFLAITIGIGYLLWALFFRPAPEPEPQVITPGGEPGVFPEAGPGGPVITPPGGPGGLPGQGSIPGAPLNQPPASIATGGVTVTTPLTDSPALSPTPNPGGGVQYYNPEDGYFYRLSSDGQLTKMSDRVFYDVDNVVWAPDKNQAIIEYPDGRKISYNFQTRQQVTLPSYWEDFSFSPDSGQIVAKSLGLDPANRWLMVAGSDGSRARALENIGTNDAQVYTAWSPNNQIVALHTKGLDFNRQEVFFVGQNDENFKSTIIEGRGFQPQWSSGGDKLLYSVYNTNNNLNPKLWIVDATGDDIGRNRRSLELDTWAEKCTFASNTEVYCAVPDNLERGAGLFPELADRTQDSLYRINLQTGTRELVAVPQGSFNISQIMIDANGNNLYFTDKHNNRIYYIRLR